MMTSLTTLLLFAPIVLFIVGIPVLLLASQKN
jgi:hypothetical protein